MYEAFFGLKQKPISKITDPRFLFLSKNREEALARIHYAVEEKEFVFLTGEGRFPLHYRCRQKGSLVGEKVL